MEKKPRSQEEVDKLWPEGHSVYVNQAHVTIPRVKTCKKAVTKIQELYNSKQAPAGRFEVKQMISQDDLHSCFEVHFLRDACDDREIVNSWLLKGGYFSSLLSGQLRVELDAAIETTGSKIKFRLIRPPFFLQDK